MAIPLHSLTTCAVSEENVFEDKLLGFNALMPVQGSNPVLFKTLRHTEEKGLVNFDFKLTELSLLLSSHPDGLRVFPSLSKDGELTVVITGFDTNGDEIFHEGGLIAVCCPQPPPPFNTTSTLYKKLFKKQDV